MSVPRIQAALLTATFGFSGVIGIPGLPPSHPQYPAPQALLAHSIRILDQTPGIHIAIGEKGFEADKKTHGKMVLAVAESEHGAIRFAAPTASHAWIKAYIPVLANSTLSFEEITVGDVSAQRAPHGAWQCSRASGHINPDLTQQSPFQLFVHPRKTLIPVNLGPAMLRGVSAWHIRSDGRILVASGEQVIDGKVTRTYSPATLTSNYFISRHDGTLLRISGVISQTITQDSIDPKSGHTSTLTVHQRIGAWMRLSNYGAKVSVTLPQACANT